MLDLTIMSETDWLYSFLTVFGCVMTRHGASQTHRDVTKLAGGLPSLPLGKKTTPAIDEQKRHSDVAGMK